MPGSLKTGIRKLESTLISRSLKREARRRFSIRPLLPLNLSKCRKMVVRTKEGEGKGKERGVKIKKRKVRALLQNKSYILQTRCQKGASMFFEVNVSNCPYNDSFIVIEWPGCKYFSPIIRSWRDHIRCSGWVSQSSPQKNLPKKKTLWKKSSGVILYPTLRRLSRNT